MPEHQVPQLQEAAAFDEAVHLVCAEADCAGAIGDAYVFVAVLPAVVVFVAGVCTSMGRKPAHIALLGLAVLLLASSIWQLGTLPNASPWGITEGRMADNEDWVCPRADPLRRLPG